MTNTDPRTQVDASRQTNTFGDQAAATTTQLGMLVGRWRSNGHIVADPSIGIRGTDTYVLFPGCHCLVHYVDVMVGETPVQAIELITPDPDEPNFSARAYDNAGMITVMQARVDQNEVWTFTGGPEVAAAAQPDTASPTGAVRSTLIVGHDRRGMHADWERTDDGSSYVDSDGAQHSYRLGVEDEEVIINWPWVRFAGRFDESGDVITGIWESSPDGSSWKYWYDAEVSRLPSR
jgi:hypothetical protein